MGTVKKALSAALLGLTALAVRAEGGYVTIMKPGKVFDEPNAKGYVTLNTKNEEVSLMPGMVFKVVEDGSGWKVIEYCPGLRGYVSEQVTGSPASLPVAGTYGVANNKKETLTVGTSGGGWTAASAKGNFKGIVSGNAVVFTDQAGNPVYSLVVLPEGTVAMSYDPGVTSFF